MLDIGLASLSQPVIKGGPYARIQLQGKKPFRVRMAIGKRFFEFFHEKPLKAIAERFLEIGLDGKRDLCHGSPDRRELLHFGQIEINIIPGRIETAEPLDRIRQIIGEPDEVSPQFVPVKLLDDFVKIPREMVLYPDFVASVWRDDIFRQPETEMGQVVADREASLKALAEIGISAVSPVSLKT